jgi:hypothetical protein
MKRIVVMAVVMLLLTAQSPAFALNASPNEIMANADRYDGQLITTRGTVKNLRETVSRRGNPYYTFELVDGSRGVKVFSFGNAPCPAGSAATVEGTFKKVTQQGRYVFYNEIQATSVACR